MNKAQKFFKDPLKYIRFALSLVEQQTTYLYKNSPFFKQGQMDIHPKSRWHIPEFTKLTGGFYPLDNIDRKIHQLEPWDNTRRDMIVLLLRTIVERNIEGEIAELGVYQGSTAKLIHHYLPERNLHLFDTFSGFGELATEKEKKHSGIDVSPNVFSNSSLALVQGNINPQNDKIEYYKGYFPETLNEDLFQKKFAFVHLDADLYEPTYEGLNFFYPRLSKHGMILIHDYNAWQGARKAVDSYMSDKKNIVIPMPDKSGSALIINSAS